jgi:hypothetical protein
MVTTTFYRSSKDLIPWPDTNTKIPLSASASLLYTLPPTAAGSGILKPKLPKYHVCREPVLAQNSALLKYDEMEVHVGAEALLALKAHGQIPDAPSYAP